MKCCRGRRCEPHPKKFRSELLYEDDDFVVVNKPAGMVVHAGAGASHGTLVNALLHRLGTLSSAGGALRPGIVHRLDRGTSGAMVVARNDVAHRALADQFRARTVHKTYIALLHGRLARDAGTIALPIARDPRRRTRMTARLARRAAKRARIGSVLLRLGNFTLVAAEPRTGRTHQIRAHFAATGHPLVGDTLYGAPERARAARVLLPALGRVFLHAARLRICASAQRRCRSTCARRSIAGCAPIWRSWPLRLQIEPRRLTPLCADTYNSANAHAGHSCSAAWRWPCLRLRGCPAGATAAAAPPPASGTARHCRRHRLRQNVNLVNVLFTVFDKRNKLVTDLTQGRFQVFDDNVRQEIRFFSRQTDLPLRVGLLLDTSNSIRERLQFEQEAAIDFLSSVIRRDKDQAFLMTVDDQPEMMQGFTGDVDRLRDVIMKQRAGGGTALYDAIYKACEQSRARGRAAGPAGLECAACWW